jgi:putative ABC transport system permease protein
LSFLGDLRIALRTLLRTPGFLLLASGVLALGIAVVVVMLGALHVTLAPPPLPQVDRVFSLMPSSPSRGEPERWVARVDLEDWARTQTSFEELAGFAGESAAVRREGTRAERVTVGRVMGGFFSVLRVQPLMGRTLTPEDARPGASPVVVLSEPLWRSTFSSRPDVLGQSIRVNGEPATVVGVAPAALDLPVGASLWVPDRTDVSGLLREADPWFSPIGRLREGGSVDAARAELRALQARRVDRYPAVADELPDVRPLSLVWMGGDYQKLMRVLLGSVSLVLALACVNVAGLLMVRGAGRTHEAAVRRALGAGRLRLAGQMLAEAVVIGAGAALGALVLAQGANELLGRVVPALLPTSPRWWSYRLDGPMLAAAMAAAAVATLGTGIYPALRAARVSIDPLLREGQRNTGLNAARLVRWLVVAEIALSSALLCASGLVIRSAAALGRGDVGVPTSGFLLARLELPRARYSWLQQGQLAGDLARRLRGIAGAEAVALTTAPPGVTAYWQESYALADRATSRPEELPTAKIVQVDEGYFDALRVPIVSGRAVGAADRFDAARAAVVSESLARTMWPGGDAVGRKLRILPHVSDSPWLTVVGVAKDVRYDQRLYTLGTTPPTIYLPLAQWPTGSLCLVLRGPADPLALASGVREAVRSLDAELAVSSVWTLDQERRRDAAGLSLIGGMFAAFGAVALALAAAGVYGVLAYSVGQGAREIAIRRALGAPDARIALTVMTRSGWQLLLGLAVGLLLAPIMDAVVGSALGQQEHPVLMYLAVAALLSVTLVISVSVPLRRALSLHPSAALRHT